MPTRLTHGLHLSCNHSWDITVSDGIIVCTYQPALRCISYIYLGILYACGFGGNILHPVIGFLRFWTCLQAFNVCYTCSYFQTDSFHSGMMYFFHMVLYSFIAGSRSIFQNSSGNGIYLFWAIWLARALRNASFLNLVSAPS